MNEPKIRPAHKDDLPRIKEVCEISWTGQAGDWLIEDTFGQLGRKPWIEWFWPNVRSKFEQHPDWIWITEVEGEVAGFVSLSIHPERQTGTIGYNALDPKFRGRGIGKKQVAYIMDIFRERSKYVEVIVAIDDGHAAAKKVYEGVGCKTVVFPCFDYGRISTEIFSKSINNIQLKPASHSDEMTISKLLKKSLAGWHKYALIEETYGPVAGKPWHEHAWNESQDGFKKDPGQYMLIYKEETPAGFIRYTCDMDRLIGRVLTLCLPGKFRTEENMMSALRLIIKYFHEKGMQYISVASLKKVNDEQNVPPKVLQELGINDVAITGDYKFMKL